MFGVFFFGGGLWFFFGFFGNVLFNNALNTFYFRLYGVGHIVKDQSLLDRKYAAASTWATLL